jgi:hypothetical protein
MFLLQLHRSAGGLNAQQQPEEPPFHFDQMVSGALAGFGGGSMGAIAGQLAALTGGGGGGGGSWFLKL